MVVSVPLRGVGCFYQSLPQSIQQLVSVPLRAVGCFSLLVITLYHIVFPSPCGVWVVSQ